MTSANEAVEHELRFRLVSAEGALDRARAAYNAAEDALHEHLLNAPTEERR